MNEFSSFHPRIALHLPESEGEEVRREQRYKQLIMVKKYSLRDKSLQ